MRYRPSLFALGGLAAAFAPQAALASDGLRGAWDGFYVRADVAYTFEEDLEATVSGGVDFADPLVADSAIAPISGDTEISDGFGFTVGAGWSSQQTGLRLEGLFIHNRVDESDGYGLQSYGLYAAASYDFNRLGLMQPFLGAGLGYNSVNLEYPGYAEADDGSISYLAQAGMAFVLTDHLVGELTYRHTWTPDLAFEFSQSGSDPTLGPYTARAVLDVDGEQRLLSLGLRYMLRPVGQ